jgi:hypothetical protein
MNEKIDQDGCVFKVIVVPRSSRNQIEAKEAGVYKIWITAPPVEGKANKALIGLLVKKLGVPKKNLKIISGTKSRSKTIGVTGLSIRDVEKLIRSG